MKQASLDRLRQDQLGLLTQAWQSGTCQGSHVPSDLTQHLRQTTRPNSNFPTPDLPHVKWTNNCSSSREKQFSPLWNNRKGQSQSGLLTARSKLKFPWNHRSVCETVWATVSCLGPIPPWCATPNLVMIDVGGWSHGYQWLTPSCRSLGHFHPSLP